MQLPNERRKHPRVRATLDLRLGLPGHLAPAHVRDISLSGVSCLTDRAIPAMTHVELVLLLPDPDRGAAATREVVCSGAVVRSHAAAGAGNLRRFETAIFFTDMKDADREDVEAFVAASRRSSAQAG